MIVKGEQKGTQTGFDGTYSLKVAVGKTLVFSYIGMQSKEVKVGASNTIDIVLEEEAQGLDEVVVLGYSKSSSKTKSTVASTTIAASAIENRPNSSFLNSIQGASPGISINSTSGSPGSGRINVKVRGIGSLAASTDPLYVIDGLISSGTEFRNLNPNDIETISVLRDAQATAIYGNYGSNGVVVITTKTGELNSGLKISYEGVTNFSSFPEHKYNLLTAKEFLLVQKRLGAGIGFKLSDDEINNYPIQTDWNKEFFRTGVTHQHNVGLRYGGNTLSSYTSFGYLKNEGIVKGTDFNRFTFRNNTSGKSKDNRFTYTAQIGLGYSRRNQLDEETNSNISNNTVQNPLLGIITGSPALAPYRYKDGVELYDAIGADFSGGKNIYLLADIINGGILARYTQSSLTANGSVSYKLLDNLSVANKSGVTYKHNAMDFARAPYGYISTYLAKSQKAAYGGTETLSNIFDTTFNSVTSISYDKEIGDHSFTVAAYLDYVRGYYSSKTQTQNGLNPLDWVLGAGTGYVPFDTKTPNLYRPSVSATNVKAGTVAYIGTFDYDYNSKYGVSGTVRRDGSYRFADGHKWETFWSVAGRWNIDKEDFLRESVFNTLKLRASYGTNGNQNLSVSSLNTNPLFLDANLVRDTYEAVTGYENKPGFTTSLKNSVLEWEKISQANIGLDFGVFNNKLEGSVDVYEKKTSDMYLAVPISGANGQYTIKGNNGTMSNKGIEVSVRYSPFKGNGKDYNLSVFANFAYNKNKITELPSEDFSSILVHAVGQEAYQWNLYHYVGVDKADGSLIFLDKNGNETKTPTANDRVLTGKSVYAPFSGGFGFDADYKGIYLTTLFSFRKGGWAMDAMNFWIDRPGYISEGGNGSKDLLNAWTPTNTNTDVPSLTAKGIDLIGSSDKYLRNTDFIKLKNITLGYNLKKEVLGDKSPFNSLKLYLMAENLVTWTSWAGFDPEPVIAQPLGVYPNPKTYSVGINLEF